MGVLSQKFRERLRAGTRPLLLDAAMGTELQRRDLDTSLPLWSAAALVRDPELVWTIHTDEVAAGAEILTANTFRTHGRSLGKAGLASRSAELTALAVQLAHRAAAAPGREIFVAGSLSPLEDCYRPDLVPDEAALAREHGVQARFLADAGVDLILAETHNTIREAAASVRAAKGTGVPVVVSLVSDGEGRLLSGEPLGDAARALLPLEPDALGINCVPAARLGRDLAALAAAAPGRPLSAYGNLGMPADGPGWAFTEELAPADYAGHARSWLSAGARIVGGCCGTTPAHTRALRELLDARDESRVHAISMASPKE
jgi:S-methylmethionine-dependent homocysteine/selenocysteine methylase